MTLAISLRSVTSPAGAIRVVSLRLLQPWIGVWLADMELDVDASAPAPTAGKVTITIGEPTPIATLTGTIDPRGSGSFGEFVHLRVLGGGAGWDQVVTRQDFQSDGGVPNTRVLAETALLVGETVHVLEPEPLGSHYVRSMGPASRVLAGLEWWVDLGGVTQVGPRPATAPDPLLAILAWDPTTQSARLTCEGIVEPGTVLVDERLPGPVTVRDVEQTFDSSGCTVVAWCGEAATSQLMGDLRSLVVEFSGRKYLQSYLYRIVQQGPDGRLQLQAVDVGAGLPDTLPVVPWTGLAGASAKYKLGSNVRLAFIEGDPTEPIVDSYEPGVLPLEATVDATLAVHVGPSAPVVALAGGATPLALAPWATALAAALHAFAGSLASAATGPLAPLLAPAGALTTALGALPPPATTKVKAT